MKIQFAYFSKTRFFQKRCTVFRSRPHHFSYLPFRKSLSGSVPAPFLALLPATCWNAVPTRFHCFFPPANPTKRSDPPSAQFSLARYGISFPVPLSQEKGGRTCLHCLNERTTPRADAGFLTFGSDVQTIVSESENFMQTLEKGILIVFEGIDGGGKTSQAYKLLQVLRSEGYDAVYFREPSDSPWGKLIREKAAHADSLSPDEELDLFQKDRRNNVTENLKPALASKQVVLLDRYYFSTMAYQGAKGLDPQKIRLDNERFAVLPDLVFVLDVDAEKGLKRIEGRSARDLLFEREDYLQKVRDIFLSLQGDSFFHIDARRPMDEVARIISGIALGYLCVFTL